MQVISRKKKVDNCVATIGTFDGVHRGHRYVLEQVVTSARERGLDAVVVTFASHPLCVLRPEVKPQMLTLESEKIKLLQETGVDYVVLLDFTEELARMRALDFMRIVLRDRLKVKMLMIGYDNHIGHDHKGFDDCCRYGEELGIEVKACDELRAENSISSTEVRRALQEGKVEEANRLLGYAYFLQGKVIEGFQNGRKLGYPTANLHVDANKLIPKKGAYFVKTEYGFGMLNVGTRPTLHNGCQCSIEVHIFDFEDCLYGKQMCMELLCWLRGEREFDSLASLQEQLEEDERNAGV
jgi:riboflavin kinase/FMN adenylyltransferase